MQDCNPISTPIEPNSKLKAATEEDELTNATMYQQIIRSLMYLVSMTRPDLSFTITFLSQFNSKPMVKYYHAAKKVLRYIRGTSDQCLLYRWNQPLKLIEYSDSS